jgi:hypothetical protein
MREELVVQGFRYTTKSETLNGWRCLDEKNKMDEKKTNPSKSDKSPLWYQLCIDFEKTNTLPIQYLQGI